MERKTTITILGICLLSLASAQIMYGGETYPFETNFTNPVYVVTGNSSNLTGMNITFDSNSKNITISTVVNFKPDNFTLIFFDNITNEKIVYRSGSRRTKYIDIIEIQNQTIYVPKYIDKEVEIEKIIELPVDNTINTETGFKTWHIIFAMICGGLFFWLIVRKKNGTKTN